MILPPNQNENFEGKDKPISPQEQEKLGNHGDKTGNADSLTPYTEILPPKFAGYLDEIHSETGFDRNYLFASMLSAFAGAMQKKFVVKSNTYVQYPALYICLVGISGKGKTPPLKAIYKVIEDHNAKLCKEYEKEKAQIEKAIAVAERMKQDADFQLPRNPKFIIEDATYQIVITLMKSNFGYQTLVMNELAGLLDNTQSYNSNSDPFYLTAYDQTNYSYDRKNGDSFIILNASLNLIGTIQTGLLSKFKEKNRDTSGLAFRFLFVFPEMDFLDTDVHLIPKDRNKDPFAEWNENIMRILNLSPVLDQYGEIQPRNVHLSDEAGLMLTEWAKDGKTAVNEKIANDENVDAESGFVAKSIYTVLRIALILETMRNIDRLDQNFTISAESALGAIKATDIFNANGLRVCSAPEKENMERSKQEMNADALLSVMELGKVYSAKELMDLTGLKKNNFYQLATLLSNQGKINRKHGKLWIETWK